MYSNKDINFLVSKIEYYSELIREVQLSTKQVWSILQFISKCLQGNDEVIVKSFADRTNIYISFYERRTCIRELYSFTGDEDVSERNSRLEQIFSLFCSYLNLYF